MSAASSRAAVELGEFAAWDVTVGDGLDIGGQMTEARFTCTSKKETAYSVEYEFAPVYANNDETHPNYQFWKATPTGKLTMSLNPKETSATFDVGTEYRLLFEELVLEPA